MHFILKKHSDKKICWKFSWNSNQIMYDIDFDFACFTLILLFHYKFLKRIQII